MIHGQNRLIASPFRSPARPVAAFAPIVLSIVAYAKRFGKGADKVVMPDNLPYREAGIDEMAGEKVSKEIARVAEERPGKTIDVQKICELSGVSGEIVKQVFYLLLGFRLLKATFFPRHRNCERVIGQEEPSVKTIKQKANAGQYGPNCSFCGGPAESEQDIIIEIRAIAPQSPNT
jgi:hypothetical protein